MNNIANIVSWSITASSDSGQSKGFTGSASFGELGISQSASVKEKLDAIFANPTLTDTEKNAQAEAALADWGASGQSNVQTQIVTAVFNRIVVTNPDQKFAVSVNGDVENDVLILNPSSVRVTRQEVGNEVHWRVAGTVVYG